MIYKFPNGTEAVFKDVTPFDRAYWLREFAGRAMQAVISNQQLLTVLARGDLREFDDYCIAKAESLLGEIERREAERAKE